MHPHRTFAPLRKLRATVCLGKQETGADFPALPGQTLADYASFSSPARIAFCLAGKMVRKNVMTPLPHLFHGAFSGIFISKQIGTNRIEGFYERYSLRQSAASFSQAFST
jgi:hypothetical protein